jgi:hypothetical protein
MTINAAALESFTSCDRKRAKGLKVEGRKSYQEAVPEAVARAREAFRRKPPVRMLVQAWSFRYGQHGRRMRKPRFRPPAKGILDGGERG